METNEQPALHPSSDEARASLDAVNRVNADLADRLAAPWWYHWCLGLIVALGVVALTLPEWWRLASGVVVLACLALLFRAWQRVTGLGRVPRKSAMPRKWILAPIAVLFVAFLVVHQVDTPVVTAVTAVVLLVTTAVVSRREDSAAQDRLRRSTRTL
jgi:hypothetical protein